MLFGFQLVGPEKFQAALGFLLSESIGVTLKEGKHIVDDDGLEIDLLLIVQVLSLEFNLGTQM